MSLKIKKISCSVQASVEFLHRGDDDDETEHLEERPVCRRQSAGKVEESNTEKRDKK